MLRLSLAVACSWVLCSPVLLAAQPITVIADNNSTPATVGDEILVVGDNGRSFVLSDRRLRAALRAFTKGRARFAPQAVLFFQLRDPAGGVMANPPPLWIERGNDRIDIALDAQNRFTLPPIVATQDGWKLRSSRSPGAFAIKPLVLSPQTDRDHRRFGDARLQCRIFWELSSDISGTMRIMGDMIGPCSSSRVAMMMRAEAPLATATIQSPDGTQRALEIRSGNMVRVPLHDNNISNDARMIFTYR